MSSDLQGYTRRKIAALMEKYRIEDDSMEAELIEACWAVRAWQPSGPVKARDKRLELVERIAGVRVDDDAVDAVIALIEKIGDAFAEPALIKARRDWRLKGRDPKNWTWITWAATAFRAAQQPAQQEPAGFEGLKDWAARHATD